MARGIDTKPYLEWLDGVESVAVSPNVPHGGVAIAIGAIFYRLGETFGITSAEPHVRIAPGTVLLPDVAFFRLDALLAVPRKERLIPSIPAEIVVEVRSPNDCPGFRDERIRRYIAWGATLILDVDPMKHTIVAHAKGTTRAYSEDDAFENDAVPWLTFSVKQIFSHVRLLGG